MRVALVHLRHAPTGGTERYLNELARHLAERDHDVEVVCRRHGAAPHPRVRFRRVNRPVLGHSWRVLSFARAVERLHARREHDVVYGLGRTWSQDVLRLGGGLTETFLAAMSPDGRVPARLPLRQRVNLAIERRNFAPPLDQVVVANSHMVARDLEARYGIDARTVRVLHNGVDVSRFSPANRERWRDEVRAHHGIEPDAPTLLFLGTGYVRKGLPVVLEAFALARRERPELRLLVAGHDSSGVDWRARARTLGLEGAVAFAGGTDRPEAYFAAGDVYALPTRYDPFANSTLEALASGLPVLTTPTNGGSEVLTPGRDGAVLAHDAGAGAWASAVLAWLAPDRLAAGGEEARACAERNAIALRLADAEELLCERALARA